MNLLEVERLVKVYGGVHAVDDVDFIAEAGRISGIIGPNGAGKTTLFNVITGLDEPTRGRVLFKGRDVTGLAAHRVARLGIARTFQNIRLFKELTVVENIMIGRHARAGHPRLSGLRTVNALHTLWSREKVERSIYESARHWMQFFGLEQSANELARNLPYGKQRALEIARALATDPTLLFLDEPAAGMNPAETLELLGMIKRVNALGITIVLIEHDMRLVMNVCERITVLNYGKKLAEGTPEEIRNDPAVIEAYLGRDE